MGIDGAAGNFFAKLWFVLQHLPETSLAPVLTGSLSLIAMLVLRRLAPRIPAALVVAVVATILVALLGGEAAGVSVVGELPSGLPHLALPKLDLAILQELAPGALAIVLVGYAEALGGAKAAAMQGGGDIDPNQELIAHGPANILSGLFGGFLVVGSLSKTSVAMAAGAHTQLANLVAAVLCFLTLVLLTPLFRGMPHPTLAAIVIAAMLHLSKPEYLRDLFARSRWEFGLAAIVVAAELTLGVPHGIALGVALSLLMLIYLTSHPQGAVLGQLPGTEAYRDVRRHPEALTFPGLLIWRVGGDLFFASIGHLGEELKAALAANRPPARHVLLDADSVNFVDTSACDALLDLIKELQSQGISFAFARVRDEVRERLRLGGIEAIVGASNFYERVTDGVLAWQEQERLTADGARTLKEPEPEQVKDDREQGEDRRYQPGDHPKTVGAAAERDAPDIHAPNARDQRCRQEYHREHRECVKVSVGLLLDLRPQFFDQELTVAPRNPAHPRPVPHSDGSGG